MMEKITSYSLSNPVFNIVGFIYHTKCRGWFCHNWVSSTDYSAIYCSACGRSFCRDCNEQMCISSCSICGQFVCEGCMQPYPFNYCLQCEI